MNEKKAKNERKKKRTTTFMKLFQMAAKTHSIRFEYSDSGHTITGSFVCSRELNFENESINRSVDHSIWLRRRWRNDREKTNHEQKFASLLFGFNSKIDEILNFVATIVPFFVCVFANAIANFLLESWTKEEREKKTRLFLKLFIFVKRIIKICMSTKMVSYAMPCVRIGPRRMHSIGRNETIAEKNTHTFDKNVGLIIDIYFDSLPKQFHFVLIIINSQKFREQSNEEKKVIKVSFDSFVRCVRFMLRFLCGSFSLSQHIRM